MDKEAGSPTQPEPSKEPTSPTTEQSSRLTFAPLETHATVYAHQPADKLRRSASPCYPSVRPLSYPVYSTAHDQPVIFNRGPALVRTRVPAQELVQVLLQENRLLKQQNEALRGNNIYLVQRIKALETPPSSFSRGNCPYGTASDCTHFEQKAKLYRVRSYDKFADSIDEDMHLVKCCRDCYRQLKSSYLSEVKNRPERLRCMRGEVEQDSQALYSNKTVKELRSPQLGAGSGQDIDEEIKRLKEQNRKLKKHAGY